MQSCAALGIHKMGLTFLAISLFANVNTCISLFNTEAIVLFMLLHFFVFLKQIILYNIFYFCTVCSVMLFLLVCLSNVAADVEN